MTIKDIKFLNSEAYMLKDLSLSLHECEEQMRKIDYDGFMMHIAIVKMKTELKKHNSHP